MTQRDLFETPQSVRDAAMEQVEANANNQWRMLAQQAVVAVAKVRSELTSSDVADWLKDHTDAATHEPRALGPVMLNAAKDGVIVQTPEYRQSQRMKNHNRPQRVWRSLIK